MIRLTAAADLHIRPDKPECRTDNFLEVQRQTLDRLVTAANEHSAPLVIAGDIFHRSTVPQWLEGEVINKFRQVEKGVCAVIGNHDVDYHKCDYLYKTSLGVLVSSDTVTLLTNVGKQPVLGLNCDAGWDDFDKTYCKVLVAHKFVYQQKPPFPGAEKQGCRAHTLPDVPLIITGDNHQSFKHSIKGHTVVNPGMATRQRSDAADHKPVCCICEVDETAGKVVKAEWFGLPDTEPEAVSREHLERSEEKKQRFEALAEHLQSSDSTAAVSFEDNLLNTVNTNRMRRNVKSKLWGKLTELTGKEYADGRQGN